MEQQEPVVRRIALLLAVEGVGLVVLAIGYALVSVTGRPENLAGAELAALAALAAGVALVLLARGTVRGRTWARSPAVVLNLLPLPVAVGLLQGGVWWAGVPLFALAGAVLYLYATPAARLALRETG